MSDQQVKDLEAQATELLKAQDKARAPGEDLPKVDYLGPHDAARRAARRRHALEQNRHGLGSYLCDDEDQGIEELLIQTEERAEARAMLRAILRHFEGDMDVTVVILTILAKDVEFRQTQTLAELIGMSVRRVHRAKQRMKHYATRPRKSS